MLDLSKANTHIPWTEQVKRARSSNSREFNLFSLHPFYVMCNERSERKKREELKKEKHRAQLKRLIGQPVEVSVLEQQQQRACFVAAS